MDHCTTLPGSVFLYHHPSSMPCILGVSKNLNPFQRYHRVGHSFYFNDLSAIFRADGIDQDKGIFCTSINIMY